MQGKVDEIRPMASLSTNVASNKTASMLQFAMNTPILQSRGSDEIPSIREIIVAI